MCLGIPAQIVELREGGAEAAPAGIVLLSGVMRAVNLALVAEEGVAPGDWVLVHAGLALNTLPEAEALELLAAQREISDAFLGIESTIETS